MGKMENEWKLLTGKPDGMNLGEQTIGGNIILKLRICALNSAGSVQGLMTNFCESNINVWVSRST
jgi:hypothetical protein